MLSHLMIYRFLIFNALAFALVAALTMQGVILPLFVGDSSRLTLAIPAVFALGWAWTLRETVIVSLGLDRLKGGTREPFHPFEREKDEQKIEWLSSVSEWLVALGLLGTVIGFTVALSGIDQGSVGNASGAQSAVGRLMDGMRIALNTTLLGASLAIWHEVNVRLLKTGLTTWWCDRMRLTAEQGYSE